MQSSEVPRGETLSLNDISAIFLDLENRLKADQEASNNLYFFKLQLLNVIHEFQNVNDAFDVPSYSIPAVTENLRSRNVVSLSNYLNSFDEDTRAEITKIVDVLIKSSNTATRLVWEQVVVGHGENGKSIYETVRDSARESILRAEQNAKAEARGQKTSPRQPGRFAQYFVHTPATEFGKMIIDPDNLKQPEKDVGEKKGRRSGLLARVRQAYAENESVLNVSWAAFIGDFFLDALEDIDPTDFI